MSKRLVMPALSCTPLLCVCVCVVLLSISAMVLILMLIASHRFLSCLVLLQVCAACDLGRVLACLCLHYFPLRLYER